MKERTDDIWKGCYNQNFFSGFPNYSYFYPNPNLCSDKLVNVTSIF